MQVSGAVPLVIPFPDLTESVYFRPYTVSLNGETLLVHLARTNRHIDAAIRPLVFLCRTKDEVFRLQNPSRILGATLVRSDESIPDALLGIAQMHGVSRLCVADLALPLMPHTFGADLLDHHLRHGDIISVGTDVPDALNAAIVTEDFLRLIRGVPKHLPTVRAYFDAFRAYGVFLQGGLRTTPFRAREYYNVPAADMPSGVPLDGADTVELLISVLQSHSDSRVTPAERFAAYKRRLIDERALKRHSARIVRGKTARRLRSAEMHVLYVSSTAGFSGAEESLAQLIASLSDRGISAAAIAPLEGRFTDRLREAGAAVHIRGNAAARGSADSIAFARRVFSTLEPEVVHCNGPPDAAFLGLAIADGIPVIQHVRSAEVDTVREGVEAADIVVTVSEFLRSRVLGLNVDPRRVLTIYNGVDMARFDEVRAARAAALSEAAQETYRPIILCIARFVKRKRHDLLIPEFT